MASVQRPPGNVQFQQPKHGMGHEQRIQACAPVWLPRDNCAMFYEQSRSRHKLGHQLTSIRIRVGGRGVVVLDTPEHNQKAKGKEMQIAEESALEAPKLLVNPHYLQIPYALKCIHNSKVNTHGASTVIHGHECNGKIWVAQRAHSSSGMVK